MLTAIAGTGTSHDLMHRLEEGRRQTDELFKIVAPDALYDRPIAERHRIIFYIGHLEAFDWNLLRERLLDIAAFNPGFDNLFAFGIDPVDGGLPADQPADWPSLRELHSYVADIRRKIDDQLAELNLSAQESYQVNDSDPFTLLNVAVEHRLMHAETLAYMFHQLPFGRKIAPTVATELTERGIASASTPSRMVEIPAGSATLGLSRGEGEEFGWDNEYDGHTVEVPRFSIGNHKVTNRQYLEFVKAGGYENRELWAPADWEWKESNGIGHPVFWTRADGEWRYRTMFREVPLPMDWPAYVSHAEASAYARWAGGSLPTEAQWHRAAYGTPHGAERRYPWGDDDPDSTRGNFDFAGWDPTPVGAFPEGVSAFGVHDLLGNGWEWTSSVFEPFDGFKPFSFYPGYSANFFDGNHYVMKGGSARTAAPMLRRSFRNWFQPHYQYVYAGFRCVSN